ncbi:MAG: AMP-binding protein [Bacteroidales bacterium]|jgi:long-chain acyl-CoA synthetase|nr:AMP-binding protein [Bacteroidales bacterium]
MTLQELFNSSCARYPERTAVAFVHGEAFSYGQMKKEVEKTMNLLARMNVKRGDRVAILSGNMPNWCIAYFAVTCMGAVAVPVLPDFHPDEVRHIIRHSGSKAVFVSAKLKEPLEGLQTGQLTHIAAIEDFSLLRGTLSAEANVTPATVAETDLASIIYTSGTTGRSKGVMLTHRNITFDAEMCLHIQKIVETDVFLSVLPLSHTYENTIGFILPIMQGAAVYYLEKPPAASVLVPALRKIRPTVMLSVPLIIEKIYRNQVQARFTANKPLAFLYRHVVPFRKAVHYMAGRQLKKTFGGRLHFFGIGGAKLDATVELFLREARFPYAIGYGLTETAPLLAGANPSQVRHQAVGPVMRGVQIKIDRPDPETGVGEILARGENVMKGYYREPEITRSVFTDGWFHTGDLGCFDKQGRLYIKGRLKTMILGAGGENIYPEDIESVINGIRGVAESLVLEQKGKLVAMVHLNIEEIEKQYQQILAGAVQYVNDRKDELNKQMAVFLVELKKYANMHLNRFSQIHSVEIMPTPFEKTPTQKIKRYLYR